MMLRFLTFIFLVLFGLKLCYAQQNAYNIPINIAIGANNDFYKTIDLGNEKTKRLIAVSLRLEGKNVNNDQFVYSISTENNTYTLLPFADNVYLSRDTFISEILYLEPEEAGIIQFKVIPKNFNVRQEKIEGFIRIFTAEISLEYKDFKTPKEPSQNLFCPCPQPEYIERSNWGSSFQLGPEIYIAPPTYTTVTHLIIHHSAGTNTSNNWEDVVASIFDFHVNTNGWQDIGYNWLIDPNGVLYEGRGGGDNVRGAHMCSYNNNTMGICLLGNFELTVPTEKMMDRLYSLLAYKACREMILADGSSNIVSYSGHMDNISGHKEGCSPNYTDCPGKFLFSKMTSIRSRTKSYMESECSNTSSSTIDENESLTLYPVPTENYICLTSSDQFKIFDLQWRDLTSIAIRKDLQCWDISNFKQGLYFIVLTKGNKSITKKFIKT